jgi:predicted amidohydrolase YtcJ
MCLSWWQLAGSAIGAWAMALRQRSFDVVRSTMSTEPRFGSKVRTGILTYEPKEAREVVAAATGQGIRVATHAVGNEGVDMVLDAYEASRSSLDRGGVPRIEHATFIDDRQIARIADLGIAVVTQPVFLGLPAFGSAPPIPGISCMPLRRLLDRGVLVVSSSDHPVAGYDPLDGMRRAVSRRTVSGHRHEPDECVSLPEALAMVTRAAARAAGLSDVGSLEVGQRANAVLLSGPLETEADLEAAHVRATWLDGERVYGEA